MIPPTRYASDRERGDIVLGWLTKIVVVLAVLGVVAFDAISVGTTHMTLTDTAQHSADKASEVWQRTHDIQKAYDAAVAAAREDNALNEIPTDSFTADPDGTVHLEVRRQAATLVVAHIGPLHGWADQAVDGAARDVAG